MQTNRTPRLPPTKKPTPLIASSLIFMKLGTITGLRNKGDDTTTDGRLWGKPSDSLSSAPGDPKRQVFCNPGLTRSPHCTLSQDANTGVSSSRARAPELIKIMHPPPSDWGISLASPSLHHPHPIKPPELSVLIINEFSFSFSTPDATTLVQINTSLVISAAAPEQCPCSSLVSLPTHSLHCGLIFSMNVSLVSSLLCLSSGAVQCLSIS